jgi:hypothetical protein
MKMKYIYRHDYGTTWSFIAMEYYLGILNRTYQIFVTPNIIAGAFVNSIMAAPIGLKNYWFVPSIYTNKRLTKKYEQVPPDSEQFKKMSPMFNFQYRRSEIQRYWYDPSIKWGMETVAHSGKLYLQLEAGRKREFILLGLQQGKEILDQLQQYRNFDEISYGNVEIHETLRQAYEQPYDPKLT